MILYLDEKRELQIDDAMNFGAFSLRSVAGQELTDTAAVKFKDGFAWVDQSALKRWPPLADSAEWQSGLSTMIAYAIRKHWIHPETGDIRAHIETVTQM